MFKIGDFSRLSRLVSVRALRYYEEVGLLKPVRVDRYTGYRYYSADQLPRLNRIQALKDLGFSLEQIARVLDEDLAPAQLRALLHVKQAELEQQVQEAQARLAQIAARLSQLEQEGTMPDYEVILKQVASQLVAGVEGTVPSMDHLGPTFDRLFDEVLGYVEAQRGRIAGPSIALYHDQEFREHDMHVAALVPLQEPIPASERVHVHELASTPTMACVVHHGPFATLNQAYSALMTWAEANGYRPAGPSREVYIAYERGGDQAKYVTEVQFPVTKA